MSVRDELVFPLHFRGKFNKSGSGGNKTLPRVWTNEEVEWILAKHLEGYTFAEIAAACDRSLVSVKLKHKRLTKSNDTYNVKHRILKYEANTAFMDLVKPRSVLDVYAGDSWYKAAGVSTLVTNDLDASFGADFSLDALKLLCQLWVDGREFDVVDLDPYGSAYECFDLALKMAKRGLIVSFGEWGHRRWKRLDFVRNRYPIAVLEDFVEDAFIVEVQRAALRNKKSARAVNVIKYENFLRIYFVLEPVKITEQWADGNAE